MHLKRGLFDFCTSWAHPNWLQLTNWEGHDTARCFNAPEPCGEVEGPYRYIQFMQAENPFGCCGVILAVANWAC
jgi:hypothetical protein